MSEIATYTFLPWLRQGIANQITDGAGSHRATIPVELLIQGEKPDGGKVNSPPIKKNIQIYGPGDIIGIDPASIVKVEPLDQITNFESNYLPYIEFYDEDFPWRYSPMPNPTDHRLLPWLALVVLKENEFEEGKNAKKRPLPYIKLTGDAQLPNAQQLWAWSHVHINQNIIGSEFISTSTASISAELETLLNNNPDHAYSRIVCPRKLEETQGYHAFLVPTFKSGLEACLGNDPEGINRTDMAWDVSNDPAEFQLPYYYRWYFKTGTVGDFEYLVRLLEPKPVDTRVGKRDMDVQRPGANLQGLRDDENTNEEDKLHGILKLGGALKIPDIFYTPEELKEVLKYRNWASPDIPGAFPHPFQQNIAAFINLTDSYEEKSAKKANEDAGIKEEVEIDSDDPKAGILYDIKNNPDPLITAPLYARWHALTQRLLKARDNTTDLSPNDNWVHELNLDPRWRVAAGFGTKVVQENQENYMKAAWEQVGEVLKANEKFRGGQYSLAVSEVLYNTHLKAIIQKKPDKWLNFATPVHNRVISEGFTVFYQKKESTLTTAATSVNMRKLMRPRAKLMKRLPFTEKITSGNLITRLNQGAVTAAPPKTTPETLQTPKDVSDAVKPQGIPKFLLDWLERYPWIKWAVLILALIIFLLLVVFTPSATILTVAGAVGAGLLYVFRLMNIWSRQIQSAGLILEENQTPETVDALPQSPNFRITQPGENFTPASGGTDSEEAKRFKQGLKDAYRLIQDSAKVSQVKVRQPLDIAKVNDDVFQQINPQLTIPRWILDGIQLPDFIVAQLKETFEEVMAYPKIELPMYKPLAEFSAELFLPNINFIDQNSISLLETNQKFIESYMVGLNHEFARELLWREYPTDQRGSYFRQFWDVSGFLDSEPFERIALLARFKKILNDRPVPELQEHYNKLLNLQGPFNAAHADVMRVAYEDLIKEELKDIKPIHYWSKTSDLGEHDNRELPGDNEEEVVLVIRGELLKKYPTAVIYAHKAAWNDKDRKAVTQDDQVIDLTKERTLYPIPEGQEDNPPPTIVKSPLYEAKVDPDIYFFGFDLTVCEAKGGTGDKNKAVDSRCADKVERLDAGWFFVIKERPGEPRFGLDIGGGNNIEEGKIELWNDLGWDDLKPAVSEGGFIQITNQTPEITADQALEGEDINEKANQQKEDKKIKWHKEMNAAELAYILYQVPVLVAVHASEMLPDESGNNSSN